MRLKGIVHIGWVGIVCAVLLIISSFATRVHGQSWGYPPGSDLGDCLASRVMKFEIFPNRDTAFTAMKADYEATKALCASFPVDPRIPSPPQWCSYVY